MRVTKQATPKILSLLAFIAVLIIPLFATPFVRSGLARTVSWQEEGVIIEDASVRNPEVVPLPDGRYRMYFDQGGQVKSAVSDDGKKFTAEKGTRLKGEMPTVIVLPNGRWRMYFIASREIKSAVSDDGVNWTVEKGVRIAPGGESDPDGIAHPAVIILPKGGYRLYYDGEIRRTEQDFTRRILSARSTDGLTWTKEEGVRINIDEAPLYADSVWSAYAEYSFDVGVYTLYFGVQSDKSSTANGIYSATSTDGLLFTVLEVPEWATESPDGQPGSETYQTPSVLNFPTVKRMYYQISGSGIYSALLGSGETQEKTPSNSWKTTLQNALKNLKPEKWGIAPPENLELFAVPATLLIGAIVILIILWKARRKNVR
ncbi:MAG: hypothetical protein BMS9Abin34_380 [Patescibacteria group bacterium]|nr:MAG: hypothetical protein BMS9Abin34_380 [Patescibacteria group bacterium]